MDTSSDKAIRLTSLTRRGGCSAKLAPIALERLLASLPKPGLIGLLNGFEHHEDAAVYRLSESVALAVTIDVNTPTVDDPFTFGRIAAANALSDIYAVGGSPKLCLNFLGRNG